MGDWTLHSQKHASFGGKAPDVGQSSGQRSRKAAPQPSHCPPASPQELLAVLQQEGPTMEGIFQKAASGTEFREFREALDHGADVDLGSQSALLLAVIVKVSTSDLQLEELLAGLECSEAHLEPTALQDFLRSIPGKLLATDLYEDWMAAMQKSSKEEMLEELKA
ncbi:hypothetical protein Q9233_007876 [Columba guinea]|nr:hypothetical protein Q9233_007876 [Columba guinea]